MYGTLKSQYVCHNNPSIDPDNTTLRNVGIRINAEIQARIEPPPTPLIKLEVDDDCTTHIIKVNMRRNQLSAASVKYNVNMNTFNDGQPEELFSLLRNFKIAIDGPGTTTPSSQINYLPKMLHGQALAEFDELQSQYCGATNNHLKLNPEGLLEYFFLINSLSKQKCVMRHTMRKHRSTNFKFFAARLKEMNNFLPLFPGSDASNKMEIEELNDILLHAVPNAPAKKSHLQG